MAAASAMEVTAAAAHKGTRQTTPGARLLLPVDLMLVNYRTRVQIHKAIQESANHNYFASCNLWGTFWILQLGG